MLASIIRHGAYIQFPSSTVIQRITAFMLLRDPARSLDRGSFEMADSDSYGSRNSAIENRYDGTEETLRTHADVQSQDSGTTHHLTVDLALQPEHQVHLARLEPGLDRNLPSPTAQKSSSVEPRRKKQRKKHKKKTRALINLETSANSSIGKALTVTGPSNPIVAAARPVSVPPFLKQIQPLERLEQTHPGLDDPFVIHSHSHSPRYRSKQLQVSSSNLSSARAAS